MGRNTTKPVLKIRYRKPGKIFGAKLTFSKNGGKKKLRGRVLSVRKVSKEQINRVGEYLPFDPEALLKELREESKEGKREVYQHAGRR